MRVGKCGSLEPKGSCSPGITFCQVPPPCLSLQVSVGIPASWALKRWVENVQTSVQLTLWMWVPAGQGWLWVVLGLVSEPGEHGCAETPVLGGLVSSRETALRPSAGLQFCSLDSRMRVTPPSAAPCPSQHRLQHGV